jgi:excisionase family DNA binding protein
MTLEDRKTCTVPEAAKILGISRGKAYGAAKSGEIPSIKIGKRIVVPIAALDLLLSGKAEAA